MATVTGWSSSFGRQTAACQKLLVEDHSMAGREGAGGLALMSLSSKLLVPHESLLLAEHNEIHRAGDPPEAVHSSQNPSITTGCRWEGLGLQGQTEHLAYLCVVHYDIQRSRSIDRALFCNLVWSLPQS